MTAPGLQQARLAAQDRWRRALGVAGRAALRHADPYRPHVFQIEAPPSARPGPRYGYGRPPHPLLERIIAGHRDTYADELARLVPFATDLASIPMEPASDGQLSWANPWIPPLDLVCLYGYLRTVRPARYLEVGSGISTLVARRAIEDGGLATELISIDPAPRSAVDAVCDRIIRQPLETVDLSTLPLAPSDVVFFDGSHRVFANSDTVVFWLEVLPALPAGVLVGVHDIAWPDDYLPQWTPFLFSEQYLLAAYLLGGTPWLRPRLAAHHVSGDPELVGLLDPVWRAAGIPADLRWGLGFWFEVAGGAGA